MVVLVAGVVAVNAVVVVVTGSSMFPFTIVYSLARIYATYCYSLVTFITISAQLSKRRCQCLRRVEIGEEMEGTARICKPNGSGYIK
jgi:hypothetical protein